MSGDIARRRDGYGTSGFTLLEVVVALAIAALALVVLFRTGASGLFAAETAARTEEAIERAQSHLAVFGRAGAITVGRSGGDDGDGYRWQLRAVPIAQQPIMASTSPAAPPSAQGPASPLVLYAVEVTISWREAGKNRSVALQTLRLGAASGDE